MTDFIASECRAIADGFNRLADLAPSVARAAELCADALSRGGKILFCGNGGSAADAQHLAAEYVGRYTKDRRPLAALALTTDTSVLTCVANDYAYGDVFTRQVVALGRPGDVLYAISTSGNSPNVLAAMAAARGAGMRIVAVTGASGGKMKDACDVLVNVPSDRTNHIQEMHIAVGHMICGLVERALKMV